MSDEQRKEIWTQARDRLRATKALCSTERDAGLVIVLEKMLELLRPAGVE